MEAFATQHRNPMYWKPVAAALEYLSGCATQCGDNRWSYQVPGECAADTRVADNGDSALVECSLGGYELTGRARSAKQIWPLLASTAPSPAGARPVLPEGENAIRIRAELPLSAAYRDDPEALARWIEPACIGVNDWASRERSGEADAASEQTGEPPEASAENIATLCALAGWPATEPDASRAAVVTLPSRNGGVCRVVATPRAEAVRFHVALDIAEVGESSPASQRAAAVALLRVAGGVRLVRAIASCVDGRIAAALEVRLPTPLDEELVRHALSALSTAHRQIGAELGVLAGQDSLAKTYLALQGLG